MGCHVVLATTVDSSDDCLVEIARAENIDYYRGHIKNKIDQSIIFLIFYRFVVERALIY